MAHTLKMLFKNLIIKRKIVVVCVPLLIIPLFLTGYISNNISKNAIIDKTIKNILYISTLISNRVDVTIKNVDSCANIITKDINTIIKFSNMKEKNQINKLEMQNRIYNELSMALLYFPDLESVAFIDTDSHIYCSNKALEQDFVEALNSDFLKSIIALKGQKKWFKMQKRTFLSLNKDKPELTYGKLVLDIDTGDNLGVLIINISEDYISSIYGNNSFAKDKGYFILDNTGTIISSQNKDEVLKTVYDNALKSCIFSKDTVSEIITVNNQKVLVTSMPIEGMGWKLVNITQLKELTKETRNITAITIYISLICFVIALFSANLLSRFIARPITYLADEMQKVKKGNLDVSCKVTSQDEIGLLSSAFNAMIERIKDLLKKIEIEQKKKREFEFALIQAQIKSHFLYNSLDLIHTLCGMGQSSEAQKTVKSLADFYRIALSNGREIITIEEEINNVSNYLSIQKVRHSEIFNYEINVQNEVLGYKIPKLTVQPLVENAIYHGLRHKGCTGIILIEGGIQDNRIIISVKDNGLGISPESLKDIVDYKKNSKSSFGIKSVDERIKLYFGDECGLTVKSKLGEWTEVSIIISAKGNVMDYA